MQKTELKKRAVPGWVQLLVSFVIPIVILTRFSDEQSLGPVWSLILALAFPVALELYGIAKYRRFSLVSGLAIGGILVTGAIGLLGLSEGWLAIRRAVPYLAAAAAIYGSMLVKRPLLPALLPHMLDIDKINAAITKKHTRLRLERATTRAGYALSLLMLGLGIASYILTTAVIDSPTGSAGFNQELARLRLIGLPAITLPLIIGVTAILYYLASVIEKLTGLDFEAILKKR